MATKVSEYQYGAFSPNWMLKALVSRVSRDELNMAVYYLIDKVWDESILTAEEIFQGLAQLTVTGRIYETFRPDDEEEEEGVPGEGGMTKEQVDNALIEMFKWAEERGLKTTEDKEEEKNGNDDSE